MRWLLLIVLLAGCARNEEPVIVTYWYLDFCSSCRATREGLQRLRDRRGDFELRLVDHRAPGAAEVIHSFGFQRHGLIVVRGGEVVFRQDDHHVRLADVEATLAQMLGPPAD